MQQQEIVTRWYKEPYMFLVIGIPLTAVAVGMVMLYNALNGQDSLISDSYYKDGRIYIQNKTAINQAKSMLIGAVLEPQDSGLSITISGTFDQAPNILKAQFIHPTLQTLDQDVLLQKYPDGSYKGAAEADLDGRWRLWLSSPEQGWMLQESINFLKPETFNLGISASILARTQAEPGKPAATTEKAADTAKP